LVYYLIHQIVNLMSKQFVSGIRCLFLIDHHFQSLYGAHYPREIVHLIITFYLKLFKLKIKCGLEHFMILFNGSIYSWGSNDNGQLGLGHYRRAEKPTKIRLRNIIKIACGKDYSVALNKNGIIHTWGRHRDGQLGYHVGHDDSTSQPQAIPAKYFDPSDPIKKIVPGSSHCVVLSTAGKVYGWGSEEHNQLGWSVSSVWFEPRKMSLGDLSSSLKAPSIRKIACGDYYTMQLSTMGEIFGRGSFEWHENRHYKTYNINLFQKCSLQSINIKNIVCGRLYTAVITNETIYFHGRFGNERSGLISLLPKEIICPNLKKIACGCDHFMILTNSGEVYVQGYNKYGQLGLGHNNDVHSLRKLQLWSEPQSELAPRGKLNLSNIKDITCGNYISFAITELNEIYVWGYGYATTPAKLIF
jgi:alpha-tubulin suppressor-like RCC1 family protein